MSLIQFTRNYSDHSSDRRHQFEFFCDRCAKGFRTSSVASAASRDKSFRAAIEETRPNFKQCAQCSHWVCLSDCWNTRRDLCYDCAPDT